MYKKDDFKDVLFILPAFNEEKTIQNTIMEIRKFHPDANILVVNDGSMDNTSNVAIKSGAVTIDLPFNLGIGVAVQTGIIFAFQNDYRWAIRMDGDGQHDPEDAATFLDLAKREKADIVIGSRFLESGGYRSSITRRIGIRFLSNLISILTNYHITDATSGYRLYSKKAMSYLVKFFPDDYPEPESIIMFYKWRLKVFEVSVNMRERPVGVSSIKALHSIYYMIKVTLAILLDMIRY